MALDKTVSDKTLLLHIGMPKTGTTAIQGFIGTQQSQWRVPELSGVAALSLLSFADKGWAKDYYAKTRGLDEESYLQERASLKHQLESLGPGKYILSHEALYDASSEYFVDVLAENLKEVFDEIEVLLYVRDQVDHFPSLVGQRVRSGQKNWQDILRIPYLRYRYDTVCDQWAEHFKLHVRDYGLVRSDVLADLSNLLGCEPPAKAKRTNRSTSAEVLKVLVLINDALAAGTDAVRRDIVAQIEELARDSQSYDIDDELKNRIRERFSESNERFEKKYLEGQKLAAKDPA